MKLGVGAEAKAAKAATAAAAASNVAAIEDSKIASTGKPVDEEMPVLKAAGE